MRDRKNFVLIFLALAIALPLGLSSLPLWLDAPSRSNPHDPLSAQHVTDVPAGPTAIPTSAGTPFTTTDTKTVTETKTPVNTFTSVVTNTPMASTPTKTPTAGGSSPTPTLTPGGFTCLLTDFEEEGTNDRDLWGGTIYTETSGNGGTDDSTINPSSWLPTGSASAPLGSGNSSPLVGRITGVISAQNVAPNFVYPHCEMAMEVAPGASAHPAIGPDIDLDVAPYSPHKGIQFDFRVGDPSVTYRLELVQFGATSNGYYQYNFSAADTNWHTQVIYFPTETGATNVFSQPVAWAVPFTWTTKIGSLQFQVNTTGADQNYDLSIDNVSFCVPAAPTPVPTPAFAAMSAGDGHVIMDFEDNGLSDNLNCALTSLPYQGPAHSGKGPSCLINEPSGWDLPGNNLGTNPGSTLNGGSAYCGQFIGTVAAGGWAVFEMLTINGGYLGGGSWVDLSGSIAANKRLRFDYRAQNDGAGHDGKGMTYAMQWCTENCTDYNFFEYHFTPGDYNWHQAIVYWPSSPFTPNLAPANGAQTFPFMPSETGEFILRAIAPGSGTTNFDIEIDNVTID